MKNFKSTIEVEISNLTVDEYFYSFDFKITVNNKLKKEGNIDNGHDWGIAYKEFKAYLKKSGAVQLALEKL